MTPNFQKPDNNWLCFFSVVWLLAAVWWGIRFAAGGKLLAAAIMFVWGLCAVGLWFQVCAAAWILMVFAALGIIYSLTKIGHAPWFRIASPIFWAVWAISLLWEFLYGTEKSES